MHLPQPLDHGGYIFGYINPGKVALDFFKNMLNLLLEYNENIFIWKNMFIIGSFWNSLDLEIHNLQFSFLRFRTFVYLQNISIFFNWLLSPGEM